MDGIQAAWEISRTASAPGGEVVELDRRGDLARWAASRTRTQASAITPRIPSEPISIRSGLGPAPEPGSRRLSQSPAG